MTATIAHPHRAAGRRDADRDDTRLRRVRMALGLAVATMPILVPAGPGNTGLADASMAVALVVTAVWLRRTRAVVGVPYVFGMGLLMIAGAAAAFRGSVAYSGITIVQDIFCLLWAAAVANAVRRSPVLLNVVVRTWVWSGLAWAVVLCVGRIAGISWMAGTSAREGGRAALTFNDPNLAANYFLCVLALTVATSVVRRRVVRVVAVLVVLLAIVFTGSNGAALGLAVLFGVGFVLWVRVHHGVTSAIAVILLSGTAAISLMNVVSLSQVEQDAANSVQILRDSLGRGEESSGTRQQLFSEGMQLYFTGDLIGVGPGQTKTTLKATAAPYVKEAHDDYVATIVERGLLGGIGLIVLIAAVTLRLTRVAGWPQPESVRELIPRPEYLVGLACALALAGMFYEVLHFRHLWAFLGLLAGIDPGWARRTRLVAARTGTTGLGGG